MLSACLQKIHIVHNSAYKIKIGSIINVGVVKKIAPTFFNKNRA